MYITRLRKGGFSTNQLKQQVIVLSGMTGVGKTDFSLYLKDILNGEIICADASQIYQGLDILTNKNKNSYDSCHLIGHWNHFNKATSSLYAIECRKIIKDILSRGKTPILEGGSGFYIHSVFNSKLFIPEEGFEEAKLEANEIMQKSNYSQDIFKKYDPTNSLQI